MRLVDEVLRLPFAHETMKPSGPLLQVPSKRVQSDWHSHTRSDWGLG